MRIIKQQSIDKAIQKGLRFIKNSQNKDGSFYSASASDSQMRGAKKSLTIFYPALILQALTEINTKYTNQIIKKAANFLLREKSQNATYNYWAKNFPLYEKEPYPDDLDDTCCALSALLAIDKKLVSESDLAAITKILIMLEKREGGPYYTWVMPRIKGTKWADVDLVVNANVGYFLSQLEIKLPNIDALINRAIENKEFESPYYYSNSVFFYYVSRFYEGKNKNKLIGIIKTSNQAAFENPLECALLGNALISLGVDSSLLEHNARYLISRQKADGSFSAYPCAMELKRLSGCKAFTTALAMEFLEKFKIKAQENKSATNISVDLEFKKEAIKRAKNIITTRFKSDLNRRFDAMLTKIHQADSDEQIILHPVLFMKALKNKDLAEINREFCLDLAVASIFGWVAYTILDNIIDEGKDIDKLSLALICNRELEYLFCNNNRSDYNLVVKQILDRVDYANFYEYKNAHIDISKPMRRKRIYSDVKFTAEKSIAHSLVPLAIIYKLGCGENSREFRTLLSFYENYLVARQLNDDAHDWEEDLGRGQINYVGEAAINDYRAQYKTLILSRDRLKLKKLFWKQTIGPICDLILDHINKARKDLNLLSHILNSDYLQIKLTELENAANKALSERNRTTNYIDKLFG